MNATVRAAELRAGALSGRLVGDQLRDVRVAGHRALDGVYAAVRDAAWGTVPGECLSYETSQDGDSTSISFVMRHRAGDVDFQWRGDVTAAPNELRFEMDGTAGSEFPACRIGFCLLHPLSLVGRQAILETVGGQVHSEFPERISPVQIFEDISGLTYDVAAGASLSIELDGDVFETEDHRNWTDAGWKTYCTPLRRGFPFTVTKGQRVRQSVTLRGFAPPPAPIEIERPMTAVITDEEIGRLPALGFGASPLGVGTAGEIQTVSRLQPQHIHVELDLSADWRPRLKQAAAEAVALDTKLDIGLSTSGDGDLDDAAKQLAALNERLGRIAVFDAASHVTPPGLAATMRLLLRQLGTTAAIGGGTRASFAELNRMELPLDELDFVTYSISPQVHHVDNSSIMDTLPAQAHTVRDALSMASGRPVVIGPMTLRMRFNPYQPPDSPVTRTDDLDERQTLPFAAAWTVGSIANLVGADALTYFHTVGWRGLIPHAGEPHHVPGLPTDGAPFPVWQVLLALAGLRGARLARVDVSCAKVAVLAVHDSGRHTVLAANLDAEPKVLRLRHARDRPVDLQLAGYETTVVVLS